MLYNIESIWSTSFCGDVLVSIAPTVMKKRILWTECFMSSMMQSHNDCHIQLRNMSAFHWDLVHLQTTVMPAVVTVIASEILVDWVKHVFVAR